MIRIAVAAALLAAAPSSPPSIDVAFYQTYGASSVSGDPGTPTMAIVVREATGCDLTGALGDSVPNARLSVDGQIIYDGTAAGTESAEGSDEYADQLAGVVLRADSAALLALVPSDAMTGQVTLSCKNQNGDWITVVNDKWQHQGFAELPLAMPDVTAETGAPLAVFDIEGVYKQSEPIVYRMTIDGESTTVDINEQGRLNVSSPKELRPGLHLITVQTGRRVMTTAFIQKGAMPPAVATATPETPTTTATAKTDRSPRWWVVISIGALVIAGTLGLTVQHRRRVSGR